jgi:competence protein ComGF
MRGRNQGFTLIEMLVVLLIVLTITSLFPLLFSLLLQWIEKPSSLHPFEWEVATSQLSMEVREAEEMAIQKEVIELTHTNQDVISYELFNNTLRRRVNGTGHEVILQHIDSVEFSYIKGGVLISVADLDGTEYNNKIYRWNDVGENE